MDESASSENRFATFAVMLIMFYYALTANVIYAAMGRLSECFGVKPELLSATVSVFAVGYYVTCVLGGILSDRLGKKKIVLLSCLVCALGATGWLFSPEVGHLVKAILEGWGVEATPYRIAFLSIAMGAFILGAGGGALEGVGAAILTDLHPTSSSFYQNVSQAAYCLGAAIPTFVMGWLLPKGVSWRWFYGAMAVLGLALGLVCTRLRLPAGSQGRAAHGNLKSTLRILPSVLAPGIAIFCYVLTETSLAAFCAIHLREILHAPENMSIYCLPVLWAGVCLGRIICANVPTRLVNEHLIASLMFLVALLILPQGWLKAWPFSMVLFGVTGLVCSGIWPFIVSLASSRNLEDSGAASGIIVSSGSLGCIAAPILVGVLFDAGRVATAYATLSAFLTFGAIILLLARLHHHRQQKG